MLIHPTLDQLKELKLTGMAEAFAEMNESSQANDLSHPEWLALLLDREATERTNKRLKRLLRTAKLRESQAAVEDLDTRAERRLDKVLFRELATCRWIRQHQNLIITGPCGPEPGWRNICKYSGCWQLMAFNKRSRPWRAKQKRQDLAGLCAWPESLPRRPADPLQTCATPVRRAGDGSRRWSFPAHVPSAGADKAADT